MHKADNLPTSGAVVMKSGNLNFLELSGPLRACNGTALPLPLTVRYIKFPLLFSCDAISSKQLQQIPEVTKPTVIHISIGVKSIPAVGTVIYLCVNRILKIHSSLFRVV